MVMVATPLRLSTRTRLDDVETLLLAIITASAGRNLIVADIDANTIVLVSLNMTSQRRPA